LHSFIVTQFIAKQEKALQHHHHVKELLYIINMHYH
jgi:hypothetical protein